MPPQAQARAAAQADEIKALVVRIANGKPRWDAEF
jgi:hypothetical protein